MRDDFLFDSDKTHLKGTGCDVLRKKPDGLKLKWRWGQSHYNEKPEYKKTASQVSSAKIGQFTCLAIYWHTEYEARVEHCSDELIGYHVRQGEGKYLKTRVEAEKKAEELFIEFYNKMGGLLKLLK
jgi:hypothetical protein